VNILADKALLAAFADNEYQVTPKHVQAAIGDSEFGVEASKKQAKKSQMFMWAGLLALGLALGYAASMWSQKQAILKESKPEIETAESLPKAAEVNKNAITAAPIAPAQASMQPNNGGPPSPASITAPTQTDDILTRRLNATTTWLASQAPTTVSIQLMGASSETQLKYDLEALSQQIEIDNIYVYRTKVNSLPFLTVLYGSFPSRVEAIQALRKLPVEIQKNRPQLRTIAGVLQETK
jgi:septal ring-binding cell division protein DamX